MMPNAYGYCRVSHEDSTVSGLGIESQIFTIRQWWQHEQQLGHFTGISWGVTGWKGEKAIGQATTDGLFIDQPVSAFRFSILKRPAGWWLGTTLKKGDVVVFARLDRAFRNLLDFADTIHRWMKKGVHCIFINPQVDMTTVRPPWKPCSTRSRSKIRSAVCCCFFGACRSSTRI